MKRYSKPNVTIVRTNSDVITSSPAAPTVNGSIGNPVTGAGDVGAPGRKRIWD